MHNLYLLIILIFMFWAPIPHREYAGGDIHEFN